MFFPIVSAIFKIFQNLWIDIPHKQGEVGSGILCYEELRRDDDDDDDDGGSKISDGFASTMTALSYLLL